MIMPPGNRHRKETVLQIARGLAAAMAQRRNPLRRPPVPFVDG